MVLKAVTIRSLRHLICFCFSTTLSGEICPNPKHVYVSKTKGIVPNSVELHHMPSTAEYVLCLHFLLRTKTVPYI